MTLELSEYITATDAAKILGISRAMVWKLIHMSRDLYAYKFGPRTVMIRRSEVERLKEKRNAR